MKKMVITLSFVLAMGSFAIAQQPQMKMHESSKMGMHHKDLSASERSTIKAKHLTLALDLTDKQQAQVQKLLEKEAKMMEAHQKAMSAAKASGNEIDFSKKMNEHLDVKIAQKREMKNILSTDQYAKWEKMSSMKKGMMGNRQHMMGNRKHQMKMMHAPKQGKMQGKMHDAKACDENCKMHHGKEDGLHKMKEKNRR